jgi:hypothetical protein
MVIPFCLRVIACAGDRVLPTGNAARQYCGRDALWGLADRVRRLSRQWAAYIHGDVLAPCARQRQHRRLPRGDGDCLPGCAIFTHEFKGAASRVPAEATAFGLRRDHVLVEILAAFVDRSDELAQTGRHAFDAMALPGGYPNLLAEGDADRVAKSYGRNVERLIRTTSSAPPFRCQLVRTMAGAYNLGAFEDRGRALPATADEVIE